MVYLPPILNQCSRIFSWNEISFQVGLKSNRTVSTKPHQYEQVGKIEEIPDDGLVTHLKGFDFVKVFRTVHREGDVKHYAVYEAESDHLQRYGRQYFKAVKEQHWQIDQFFRVVKQTCHLERFFVRKARAVINHVYSALRTFQRLAAWAKDQMYESVYALRKTIFIHAQRDFIRKVVA
jgi:hypothetical protein